MTKNQYKLKYLFLGLLAVFSLSACGKSLEAPESVMDKAKQALVDMESARIDATAEAKGNNGTDDLSFSGDMTLAFDKKDPEDNKMDLHLALSGDLQAGEKVLNGDLDFNFISSGKQYYVKLNQLNSSDESLTAMKPFIDLYSGKWLRIAEDFIPQNIRDLQTEDEALKLKQKQLEQLFVETRLFDVVKEYGMEKLDGRQVYHYGLQANMNGFKDYMTKAAMIDGRELTIQEIEESLQVLSYLKKAEIYVDSENYYLLKSVLQFTGEALSESANLQVEITVDGSDYNEPLSVDIPEDAEDFNPLSLVMGLGGVPGLTDESGTALEGVEVPEPGTTLEMEGVSEGISTDAPVADDSVTEVPVAE